MSTTNKTFQARLEQARKATSKTLETSRAQAEKLATLIGESKGLPKHEAYLVSVKEKLDENLIKIERRNIDLATMTVKAYAVESIDRAHSSLAKAQSNVETLEAQADIEGFTLVKPSEEYSRLNSKQRRIVALIFGKAKLPLSSYSVNSGSWKDGKFQLTETTI